MEKIKEVLQGWIHWGVWGGGAHPPSLARGVLISISRDRKIGNIVHSIIIIKLKVISYNLIQSNSMSLAIQCKCNNVY